MIDLPTAKEVTAIAPDVRAIIAKRSRNKGSNYERDVAKKIAAYFGQTWTQCFYRTKPHGHAQPEGDIKPINEMYARWKQYASLGPIECKSRAEWSWNNFFKNPEKSYLLQYWRKSNEDTGMDNTVLIFTKPSMMDFVMHADDMLSLSGAFISFEVEEDLLIIQTLDAFLKNYWPL